MFFIFQYLVKRNAMGRSVNLNGFTLVNIKLIGLGASCNGDGTLLEATKKEVVI